MNVVRVALPGFNALTDTNIDHFSLYADVDNVLIKRKVRGQATINDGSPTILTIPHNLDYIPFFVVYYFDEVNSMWSILNNQFNAFSVPQQICAVDTTNLYIYNFGGHGSGHVQVAYDIFYDNMNDNTAPAITESPQVFKVARPGKNALTSKNPNDYIMHSDLNNYKILGSGRKDINIAGLTNYSFAHGVNITTPCRYIVFIYDHNDSGVFALQVGGNALINRVNNNNTFFGTQLDPTNLKILFPTQSGTPDTISILYYIFGSGVNNTIATTNPELAVAAPGHNVFTESNPDNFNFHSSYPTLKYFTSGNYSMTVNTNTTHVIPHNLGYVPFFITFVNDLAGTISNAYAITPYYWGRSSVALPNRDIAAWAYADNTNIYLRAFFQPNAIGTNVTFNFYYKIFKNNLGL